MSISLQGDVLPGGNDSLGMSAPTASGFDLLTTDEVVVPDVGGRPTAILFAPLADWCPHCPQHVEDVAEYLAAGNTIPPAIHVVAVVSYDNPSAQYPQNEWLAGLGWTIPTLVEPSTADIGRAYALVSVPTWVLIDPDGNVAGFADGHVADVADVIAQTVALAG